MTGEIGSDQHIASQLADLSERMVGHEDASLVAEAASRLMHRPALGPALNTVLEAVEAFTPGQWRNVSERVYNDSITSKPFGEPSAEHSWREGTLRLLRALRAEQSADAGGERGGG